MPRGGANQFDPPHVHTLPPVELDDPLGRHAPVFEMSAKAERNHKERHPVAQRFDRRLVEVIVVIVREDDRIDRWQIVEREGRCKESFHPEETARRSIIAPHRIDEDPTTLDFHQQGRVPKPRDPQIRGGHGKVLSHTMDHRQRLGRLAKGVALKEPFLQNRQHLCFLLRKRVDETTVGVVWGALQTLKTSTLRLGAEGRPDVYHDESSSK